MNTPTIQEILATLIWDVERPDLEEEDIEASPVFQPLPQLVPQPAM